MKRRIVLQFDVDIEVDAEDDDFEAFQQFAFELADQDDRIHVCYGAFLDCLDVRGLAGDVGPLDDDWKLVR